MQATGHLDQHDEELTALPQNECPAGDYENYNKPTTMKALSQLDQDVVRLIGQHLHEMGLDRTADQLAAESGCGVEHPAAAKLRAHVIEGNWEQAKNTLMELKDMVNCSEGLVGMQFHLLEQQYLEYLDDGQYLEALNCLRRELTPLNHNTKRIHNLATYLMTGCPEELREMALWEGKGLASRQKLLEKIQKFLPSNVMLPSKRLRTLLNQAIDKQHEKCVFHDTNTGCNPSNVCLFNDHVCSKDDFPAVTCQILNEHCDEVWICKFSPDGTMLASGSKDGTLLIWDVDLETHQIELRMAFEEHPHGVAFISWSPDGTHILSCGIEECYEVWVWDVIEGKLRSKVRQSHEDSLTSAAWLSDSYRFVTGGIQGQFYLCNIDGQLISSKEGVRVQSLAYKADRNLVLAADTKYRIKGYNFEDLKTYKILEEDHPIISFSLCDHSRYALVNVATQGVHLWDLNDQVCIGKYQGVTQGYYVIFSCFGGQNQDFIASGSEDGIVYIWHRRHDQPVMTLKGHEHSVNCVDWNPKDPSMLVSASDDGSLRVWGPVSRAREGENPLLVDPVQNTPEFQSATAVSLHLLADGAPDSIGGCRGSFSWLSGFWKGIRRLCSTIRQSCRAVWEP